MLCTYVFKNVQNHVFNGVFVVTENSHVFNIWKCAVFFFCYEKSNFAMKMRCDFVSVLSCQIFIVQNITFRQCKLLPFLLAFWLAYHKFFFKNIYVIFFSKEKWREKRVFKNGNLVSIWGNYLADFAL